MSLSVFCHKYHSIVVSATLIPCLLLTNVKAEVVTDGSVGARLSLQGSAFVIPQSLGSTAGKNLFHSFQRFNIANTESATFTGSNNIRNVISRVTGGEISNINGVLRSQVGQADFYFMNPNGIIIGADAIIDVPAALHLSTAAKLKFSDDAAYNAVSPNTSHLSSVNPIEFGFLGDRTSQIRIESKLLQLVENTTMSLTAGEIIISQGVLTAEAGEIKLAANGRSASNLSIHQQLIEPLEGRITIDQSTLSSNGNGSGRIQLNGGDIGITNNSLLSADNTGGINAVAAKGIYIQSKSLNIEESLISTQSIQASGKAANIQLASTEAIQLSKGTAVFSISSQDGDAGDITLDSTLLLIDGKGNQTGIFNNTAGSAGNPGNVTVSNKETLILNGGVISTNTDKIRNDESSSVLSIQTNNLTINGQGNQAGITASSLGNGQGQQIKIYSSDILISDGGVISSNTSGMGDAGTIQIEAENIILDGDGIRQGAVIQSGSFDNVNTSIIENGNAGKVIINSNNITIANGASIITNTESNGNAGKIRINSNALLIDGNGVVDSNGPATGIDSNICNCSQEGKGGAIEVRANDIFIINGGDISNSTFNNEDAGTIDIKADFLLVDGTVNIPSRIRSDAANSGSGGNINIESQSLILNGGLISSGTQRGSTGHSGSIRIVTNKLETLAGDTTRLSGISTTSFGTGESRDIAIITNDLIMKNAFISSVSDIAGRSGNIDIQSKRFLIDGQTGSGAILSSGTFGIDGAGSITVSASDALNIENGGAINSDTISEGNAGSVTIFSTDTLNIMSGGVISSSTSSEGKAGSVSISANSVFIDGKQSLTPTGIASIADKGSSDDAGNVSVSTDQLTLINGAAISSGTFSQGNAGTITVQAKNLQLNGRFSETSISSDALEGSGGNAGNVNVFVEETLNIVDGGVISSDTFAGGRAGKVNIQAKNLVIDGLANRIFTGISSDANPGSSNDAGNIDVTVMETLSIVNNGQISSDTSSGNAGTITIQAKNLTIDSLASQFLTSISSDANIDSSGNAGSIKVSVTENLEINNGAVISSNTFADGSAGLLMIKANSISLDQGSAVISGAALTSAGQSGSISIKSNTLTASNNSTISVQSLPSINATTLARIEATDINIQARTTQLNSKATITAQSDGNVPASNIIINATNQLKANNAQISTAANQANGGNITIGGNSVFLNASRVTTSVAGNGNGGDITLNPKVLVLNTGFVQANTAGANASGGAINIDSEVMISSNNHLSTGGNTPVAFQSGFNVIQAAAPDGVSGSVAITSPELNISGTLANLDAQLIDIDSLSKNPCASPAPQQSKLSSISKGGLPNSVEQSLSVSINLRRLQKMLDQSAVEQQTALPALAMNIFADKHCF